MTSRQSCDLRVWTEQLPLILNSCSVKHTSIHLLTSAALTVKDHLNISFVLIFWRHLDKIVELIQLWATNMQWNIRPADHSDGRTWKKHQGRGGQGHLSSSAHVSGSSLKLLDSRWTAGQHDEDEQSTEKDFQSTYSSGTRGRLQPKGKTKGGVRPRTSQKHPEDWSLDVVQQSVLWYWAAAPSRDTRGHSHCPSAEISRFPDSWWLIRRYRSSNILRLTNVEVTEGIWGAISCLEV